MADGTLADFVSTHRGLVFGGTVIVGLLIGSAILRRQNATPPTATPNSNLGGLTNGLVYVPTQTNFTTENVKYGPFSNDPNLTTVTNSPTNSNNPTTINKPITTNNGPAQSVHPVISPPPTGGPPARKPPAPQPAPPPRAKSLIWDTRYSIRGGETLSIIAANLTRQLRAAGMPGSSSITWHDLYAHNTTVINATAAAHHNPIPGGPWNDIFPGESIIVPRWG